MTGPAYVAYVKPERYQPRCHGHRKVWSADITGDLDAALEVANGHNSAEHAATTSQDRETA